MVVSRQRSCFIYQFILDTQNALARRTNEIECSIGSDVSNPIEGLVSVSNGYIVVQRSPPIVKGPYSDLQLAKNELKEIAKNGKSRMMLEIIDGAIQVEYDQVHNIDGSDQIPANGFAKHWSDWYDILGMIEIAKQHLILHKKNFSGKNTNHPLHSAPKGGQK